MGVDILLLVAVVLNRKLVNPTSLKPFYSPTELYNASLSEIIESHTFGLAEV